MIVEEESATADTGHGEQGYHVHFSLPTVTMKDVAGEPESID